MSDPADNCSPAGAAEDEADLQSQAAENAAERVERMFARHQNSAQMKSLHAVITRLLEEGLINE